MPCYKPITCYRAKGGGITFSPKMSEGLEVKIPCGQCIGCRIDRSKQWAIRCVHEAKFHDKNSYITLTYNDVNLPYDGGLNHRHFQLFMKRLRKKIQPNKVRYYMCGEYGDKNQRPHYHAILFGWQPEDLEFFQKNYQGDVLYKSQELEDIWQKGFVTVGDVTYQSAAYCARYVMKKITGDKADVEKTYQRVKADTGEVFTVSPEYNAMSRRPGLGKKWFDERYREIIREDFCVTPDGKKVKVPNTYFKWLELEAPYEWERIKEERAARLDRRADDLTPERLKAREFCQQQKLKRLDEGRKL